MTSISIEKSLEKENEKEDKEKFPNAYIQYITLNLLT